MYDNFEKNKRKSKFEKKKHFKDKRKRNNIFKKEKIDKFNNNDLEYMDDNNYEN